MLDSVCNIILVMVSSEGKIRLLQRRIIMIDQIITSFSSQYECAKYLCEITCPQKVALGGIFM
jgi:hypothetical protein